MEKTTKNTTQKVVMASLFAALVCVATMIIKIPSPLSGYINPGDCIVLLSGWLLPPTYGFLAAGLGSALADLFSGYVVYAVATFFIKGVMALIAYFCAKHILGRKKELFARLLGGALAELFMILGYFLFEGVLYGFPPSLLNVPVNGVQGACGLVLGLLLYEAFKKIKPSI